MKKIIFTLVVAAVLLTACTKTNQDDSSTLETPIVESFLAPAKEALVRLTTAIPYTTDTTIEIDNNITDAQVYISYGEKAFLLSELVDSAGYYREITGEFEVEAGQTYQLEFQYNNNEITASTTIPLKPENFEISETTTEIERITEDVGFGPPDMTEIELSWDNETGDYFLIYIQYLEDEYDTINTVIELDEDIDYANFSSDPLSTDYYTFRSMQFRFFGEYQVVLSRITETYAQLYETLSQSSLEGLTEPPTNVTNGMGVFAAFNSDTLTINVVEQ